MFDIQSVGYKAIFMIIFDKKTELFFYWRRNQKLGITHFVLIPNHP